MDPGSSHPPDSPKPKRLKTMACDLKFPEGNTLLHQFVLQNSDPNDSCCEDTIRAVLLSMSDVVDANAFNDDGYSALGLAVLKNNRVMVRKLVSCLVDVNGACRLGDTDLCIDGQTALCVAAESGHLGIVKVLVSEGADVNKAGMNLKCDWSTPLSCAASAGHLDIVEFLVRSGADISAHEWLALQDAALSGNLDVVRFLLDTGVSFDFQSESGSEVFNCAVVSGNLPTIEYLVSKGADVNGRIDYDTTPLHTAVQNRSCIIEIVEYLIDKGSDLDAKDEEGCTPLHYATCMENTYLAELLIDKGADLNAKDTCGYTLLHHAVLYGKVEFVRLLVDKGADVNARDINGKTPLDFAREMERESLFDALQNVN